VAIWFGIQDPTRSLTTDQVARHPESLFSRIRVSASFRIPIPFFPRRPSLSPGALRRFRTWAREEIHHELPLLFLASFLFSLSANLYNITYTPYLVSVGLAASSIFLVNFSNNFVQTLVFPISGGLATRFGADRMVQWATYLRALGYLATAGFTFFLVARSGALEENLIVFGILGGAIAVYTTASSLMLYRALEGRDAGSLLGVNSALGGVAAVTGAGLSAVLAEFGSYRLVFLVAAGSLLVSLPLWSAASVAYTRRKYGHATPPLPPASGSKRAREARVVVKTP
jgi:MFS family permease